MNKLEPGKIVFLNGTSSAGKTTLAKALQASLDEPYLCMGIDHFLSSVPQRLFVYTDDENHPAVEGWLLLFRDGKLVEVPRLGPTALHLLQGMYATLGALADAGINVIFDDVIYDPRVLQSAISELSERNALFVGIRCPLEVVIRREQERGDRAGGAALFHSLVHAHGRYDLEVDTSLYRAQEGAAQVKAAILNQLSDRTFRQLRSSFG
ncbi:MAG: hypothetical protein U0350_47095 [Caldilineaceae bacterium]